MVSTHLKNISQIGSFPQVGVKIKNIWKHHLANIWNHHLGLLLLPRFEIFWFVQERLRSTLPETNCLPLKIGLLPQKETSILTIHFQVLLLLVSGRVFPKDPGSPCTEVSKTWGLIFLDEKQDGSMGRTVSLPTFILTKTTFHIPYMDPMGKVEIYDDMIKSDDMSWRVCRCLCVFLAFCVRR